MKRMLLYVGGVCLIVSGFAIGCAHNAGCPSGNCGAGYQPPSHGPAQGTYAPPGGGPAFNGPPIRNSQPPNDNPPPVGGNGSGGR